jgi:hypothetical protein
MGLSNAERQRRFIERLKARAGSGSDGEEVTRLRRRVAELEAHQKEPSRTLKQKYEALLRQVEIETKRVAERRAADWSL